MSEINESIGLNATVNIDQNSISLNNEGGKKTTASTTEDPWVPDEAKKKYHNQRLGQSKWAFRLSFCGSIAGFLILIWSIRRGIEVDNPEWVGMISGGILEGVSVLFYTLSNKANEKISEFFKELTKDSNVKDALKLADDIEDSEIKDQLKVKLALHLVGIDEERICKNTTEICKKNIDEN